MTHSSAESILDNKVKTAKKLASSEPGRVLCAPCVAVSQRRMPRSSHIEWGFQNTMVEVDAAPSVTVRYITCVPVVTLV